MLEVRVSTVDEATGKRVYTRTEVGNLCGVTNQTIRSWEDAGYIPPSIRGEDGYRYWYEEEVKKIIDFSGSFKNKRLRKQPSK